MAVGIGGVSSPLTPIVHGHLLPINWSQQIALHRLKHTGETGEKGERKKQKQKTDGKGGGGSKKKWKGSKLPPVFQHNDH